MSADNFHLQEIKKPLVKKKLTHKVLGFFNNARLGSPRKILIGAGGIGDDLLCSTVFHELKKRDGARLGMYSKYPGLFENNSDIDFMLPPTSPLAERIFHHGLPVQSLSYSVYNSVEDRDEPLKEHLLVTLCRKAGISGEIALRPYLHLRPEELAVGKFFDRQIAIQSSALGSTHPMRNKEWLPGRFQWVTDRLKEAGSLVQLGAPSDPLLEGALDLRGKTNLRESAAVLANSLVFVGSVGFLMHMARAVDCRSAIVYGGREIPELTGYSANTNVTGPMPCSPCWLRNTCPYDLECMRKITPESVLDAALSQIAMLGSPLRVDAVVL